MAGFTLTDSLALAETAMPAQDRFGVLIGDDDPPWSSTQVVDSLADSRLKAPK